MVERRELRDQLGGVIAELEAGRAELEEAAAAHRLYGEVASALHQRLGGMDARDQVAVPDTLVGPLFSHFTMDVVTATTRAFLDAGGGAMLDDGEEGAALAAWPAKMRDAIDDQAQLRLMVQDGYHAYMVSTFSLGNAIPAGSDMIGRGLQAALGLDVRDFRSPPSSVVLRPTPELLNHLVWRKTAAESSR